MPVAVVLAAVALVGCSSDGSSQSPAGAASPGAAAGTTVNVGLQEWAVVPESDSVPAGDVTFAVTNDGPEDIHEFVVLRTDLDAGALPTGDNGAVDEEGGDMTVVDEIEDVAVGSSQDLTVSLDPGHYVLLCNIYDEDEQEAHYQMGMRINFTVE